MPLNRHRNRYCLSYLIHLLHTSSLNDIGEYYTKSRYLGKTDFSLGRGRLWGALKAGPCPIQRADAGNQTRIKMCVSVALCDASMRRCREEVMPLRPLDCPLLIAQGDRQYPAVYPQHYLFIHICMDTHIIVYIYEYMSGHKKISWMTYIKR